MFFRKTSQAIAAGIVAVMAISLSISLWQDASKSISVPLPGQYGEGIMAWMSREIDEGRLPYGDILGAPSRYSCYGPLPSTATALLSRVIPREDGMRYVIAGRAWNLFCWLVAGFALGLLSGRPLVALATSVALPLSISHISFMWTFRVDSSVAALESLILLVLARRRQWELSLLLPVLLTSLALTKPPAAVDLMPLLLMALAVSGGAAWEFVKQVIPKLLIAGLIALVSFFLLDWIQGGWMSNNILWEQKRSGWNPDVSMGYNLGNFFLKVPMWPVLLWAAWGIASQSTPSARSSLAAVSISLAMCGAATMKFGGDVNYYVPTLVLLVAMVARRLTTYPQTAVFLAAVYLSSLPLGSGEGVPAMHRVVPNYAASQQAHSEFLTAAHDTDNALSEDPFFSVLALRHPLITDVFQYNIAAHREGKVPSDLVEMATVVWGGSRIKDMLANWGSLGTSSTPLPVGIPYMPEAFLLRPTDGLKVSSPPFFKDHPSPWREYLRRILYPALILLLAALFWGPRHRPVPSSKTTQTQL